MRVWKKPVDFALPPHPGRHEMKLTCRFISPVLGGGVDPKQFDPVTPVRAPAIRGQLRFWWRATHADLLLDELCRRETVLFGGVDGKEPVASAISVDVAKQPARPKRLEVFQRGNAFKLADDRLRALAYGAFPLRALDAAKIHDALFLYDNPFEIVIRTRDIQGVDVRAEIERALWAWLHFGGLGARTRRGFGALGLVEPAEGWTLKGIAEAWPSERDRQKIEWPVLPAGAGSVIVARETMKTGREAQEKLLDLLHRMRQGERGRKPNRPRPGRSYWPEPDAIRKIYRITSGRHAESIHDPRIDKFPRAAFGTPIIFHFKTEAGEREPPDTTLVPARVKKEKGKKEQLEPFGRLASPLILRPHFAGDGVFEAMAMRLEHPAPTHWVLLEGKRVKGEVKTGLTDAEARRIRPLVDDAEYSHSDPIDTYLTHLATI